MRKIFARMINFILANLICVGIYAIAIIMVALFFGSVIETLIKNNDIFNTIVYGFCTFGFVIPFYFLYFMKSDEFKFFYLQSTTESKSFAVVLKNFLMVYGKTDILCFLIITILLALFPQNTRIGFLFMSISFFYDIIPYQIVASLLWYAYIIIVYFCCFYLSCKHWEKRRLHK